MVWGVDGACAAGVELGKGVSNRVASIWRRVRARSRVRMCVAGSGPLRGEVYDETSIKFYVLGQVLSCSEVSTMIPQSFGSRALWRALAPAYAV